MTGQDRSDNNKKPRTRQAKHAAIPNSKTIMTKENCAQFSELRKAKLQVV